MFLAFFALGLHAPVEEGETTPWLSSLGRAPSGVLVELRCLSSPNPDLEKRKNPVCHFVTPLDGSVDVDEHRRPEVLNQQVIE